MTFVLYAAGIVLVGLIAVLVAWPLLAAQTESVQASPSCRAHRPLGKTKSGRLCRY